MRSVIESTISGIRTRELQAGPSKPCGLRPSRPKTPRLTARSAA